MNELRSRVAIVAALQREINPLVRHWRRHDREYQERVFRFFEDGGRVLVCGGIGGEAARRATEAVISLYAPEIVYSVGFAGALDPEMKIGDLIIPSHVVDARDSSRIGTGDGQGVLVTCDFVATPDQKANLQRAYDAQAVDMEAAAVARGAQARGIRFGAVKAISDDTKFAMPPLERFIAREGQFQTPKFVIFVLFRPWLWRTIFLLMRNSAFAMRSLCRGLSSYDFNRDRFTEPVQSSEILDSSSG